MLTAGQSARYARQIMLAEIGESGQEALLDSSVLIVGLGGLGCPVALYLAGAGVGHIGLCDPDTVAESNLHRQLLYDSTAIGESKAEAARRRLAAIASFGTFSTIAEGLTMANARALVNEYDLVIDCTDNFRARYLIEQACRATGKLWVHGAVSGFEGMVSTFGRGYAYSDLWPAQPDQSGPSGIIGPTAGTIGSIQATEAINILTSDTPRLLGKLLTINLLTLQFNLLDL